MESFGRIFVGRDGPVGIVEFEHGPENFFDVGIVTDLAAAYDELGKDPSCRAIVLRSRGRVFCAGASYAALQGEIDPNEVYALYDAAARLFRCNLPAIAAVQGSAVGGGLGLVLSADFRVGSPDARFSANFVKIGIHPGFGISLTLPHVIGWQRASMMMQTGRRIKADLALSYGLLDELVPAENLESATIALAHEIAEGAPLAISATRATIRQGLADEVARRVRLEAEEQLRLYKTNDFQEGVRAVQERRPGRFTRS